MNRLVVVSNRVAWPGETVTGGLASALRTAFTKRRGMWFGWSGQISDNGAAALSGMEDGGVDYVFSDLTKKEYEEYYLGFSNRTLWPLCHYRPSLLDYRRRDFEGYCSVNQRFAQILSVRLCPGDTIWVHDYHLIPLGQELRDLGVTGRLGFFLHIPFPPPALATLLPHHELLFPSLAAYDLIGVQTEADAGFLTSYLVSFGGVVEGNGSIRMRDGRRTRVQAFPIGIDATLVAAQAEDATAHRDIRRLDASLEGRKLVFGVDRLDYSKGLPQRFEAFGGFLQRHDEWRGRVSYLQIAPPTREEVPEYKDLQHRLEHLAGAINGRFADPHWMPIRYVNRSFDHAVLAGYYRIADVGLVTPLRDGMNLVAKEFIAAQPPEDPGVLILSCFAGAARQLGAALIINPFDPEDIVESLYKALTMPLHDRKARWRELFAEVASHGIDEWITDFLSALDAQAGHQDASGRVPYARWA